MKRTILALGVLTMTAAGCASEGVTCTAASLSYVYYQDKSDFDGQWELISTLAEIDGDLPLMVGAESPARVVEWEVTEEWLLVGSEPELAYNIAGHATVGKTQDGRQCTITNLGQWSERGHFRVDLSYDYAAYEDAGGPVPGAAAEWLVEPLVYVVEEEEEFEPPASFVRDADERVETIALSNHYLVTTCDECTPVQVNVVHRFERLD